MSRQRLKGGRRVFVLILSIAAGLTGLIALPDKPGAKPTPIVYEDSQVVKVIDGDTIIVRINGKDQTVRLIGVDTPETSDPRKPVQCFGKEASAWTKQHLSNRKVRLESDPTQGELDRYQRRLAYVFRDDGLFINQALIAEGFAHEYTYQSSPYKYQTDFQQAERQARVGSLGLWNMSSCDGDTTQSAPSK